MNKRLSAAEILRHLVAIATPSAVSNQLLIVWVQEFLMQRGWDVQTLHYADENDIQKANLIARPFVAALNDPIELAFVCHTDTVPAAAKLALCHRPYSGR